MTKNVVFDSYALIAHFKNEPGASLISDLFTDLLIGEKNGFISVINVGEVYYMLSRKAGIENAEKSIEIIRTLPIKIVDADFEITYAAAQLKARHKFSYADSFAAALTIIKKGTLVTGDKEFKNLSKEKGFKVHFIH
ncbi:MAG: type II toxin-antitoxin system VapC family toxin [Flammeovirgaceae bacterium]|nr:type II toxin-antitoxin system VapC family toxin [Flammeovirgaceae bacterium]